MIRKMSPSLIKVINMLNDGAYHDGTTIGKALGMSRSAVWKIIRKLKAYSLPIASIKGKGYALKQPLVLLDANKIKKKLINTKINIHLFESITSTNDYFRAHREDEMIAICLAEQQTKSRGRLNRQWYSPFGQNIYMSMLVSFQKDISELSGLSLVTTLAVLKTLKSFGIKDELQVKWPNDIIYAQQKISGTLIEIQAETHGLSQAIIGMGINVNMRADQPPISQSWTSMSHILNEDIDRNDVCARLINQLLSYLQLFESKGFAQFKADWLCADYLMEKMITLQTANQQISGKVVGVNDQGHLQLKLADGTIRAFSSGDTSVMKGCSSEMPVSGQVDYDPDYDYKKERRRK